MDRHSAESKIEDWVHQLFGETSSGGASYDAVMEAGSFGDEDYDVAKVDVSDMHIDDMEDPDLKKLLDGFEVPDLEDPDEDKDGI